LTYGHKPDKKSPLNVEFVDSSISGKENMGQPA